MMLHTLPLVCAALAIVGVNGLYTNSDDVQILTAGNFQHKVVGSDDLWLVEFYAPWCGHCKNLAPEWKKAATALKGIVKVGAVDLDTHQSVGGPYNIRGFPTIKIFGTNKNSPKEYQGGRTAQSIVDTAMQELQAIVRDRMSGRRSGGGGSSSGGSGGGSGGSDVVTLTDANFEKEVLGSDDMWLVEFYAPWCGHCKRLEPEWKSAASQLKGKVKLGALDATVHTVMASRFQVQGYPTIKMFPAGKKDWNSAQEYEGGRTSSDIVRWAEDKNAANIPPPEVLQVTDESVLTKACENNQLCIVSVLPHILDCQSKCRNDFLSTLKVLAEKFKRQQWGWVWAEAGQQLEMESSLDIGGFGYPAMAAVNSRKAKFSLMRGSFGETGINEFLRSISVGRGSTAPLKNAKLPAIKKVDAWDGKDGVLEPEEDIDLSDVSLDDLDDKKKDEL